MHMTLADLPNELLLLAIELGEFDVRDALHVRWTSQRLRQISTMTSFWLPTALKIQTTRPLPLPPFRPLERLTAQELMFICIRHQCITDNLNATQPTPWMTRQLSVGSEQGLVEYFAFIPGGRHAIIYHGGSDSFHLLDLGFAPERAASSLDDPANDPLQAGRILASFHPDFVNRVEMFDFYTCGENESTIMIATVSMVADGSSEIIVFSFNDIQTEPVQTRRHFHADLRAGMASPDIVLRDSTIAISYEMEDNEVHLIIIDWVTGAVRYIDPMVRRTDPPEMYISRHGAVCFYFVSSSSIRFLSYHKATLDLQQGHHGPPLKSAPNVNIELAYHQDCCYPENGRWRGMQPWNVPNPRTCNRMAVITTSRDLLDNTQITAHWLDLDALLEEAQSCGFRPEKWRLHRGAGTLLDGIGGNPSHTSIMIAGTSGQHAVILREAVGEDDVVSQAFVEIYGLHSSAIDPTQPVPALGPHIRFPVPEDITLVSAMNFSDEHGILAIASGTIGNPDEDMTPRIDLLYF